jgi:hypothetical protein
LTGGGFVNDLPPGTLRAFQQLDSIANFGPADYVVVTSSGVFITTDVTAAIVWTQLGAATTPTGACGVDVSKDGATTVFFVKSGSCNGDIGGTLWRFRGTDPAGTWQQITREGGGSFWHLRRRPG